MTREESKELLPTIHAFADGKRTIQDWIKDTWKDKKIYAFWRIKSISHKAPTQVQTIQDPRRMME